MLWARGMSHLGVPRAIIDTFLLVAIAVKTYDLPMWISFASATTVIILVLITGYWDVKSGFYKAEQSIHNQHNPELLLAARK